MLIPIAPARVVRLRVCTLLLLVGLVLPLSGRALGIGEIEPLYFNGPDGYGFSTVAATAIGRSSGDFLARPTDLWLTAGASGSGSQLEIAQTFGTVHQDPGSPSFLDPVIADSTWTIRNMTSATLVAPLLVFTTVDPMHLYPITLPPTGLDANLLKLLSYSVLGTDFLFGVIQLPDLAPGATAQTTARYVVAGALAGGDTLPPLAVAGLRSYGVIPEPSTVLLFATGVLWLAAAARRRRARA